VTNCAQCGAEFPPKSKRQRFCSDKCRYKHKDANRFIPCAECGSPMLRSGKTVPGTSVCWECKHGAPKIRGAGVTHGNANTYSKYGCRCRPCTEAAAASQREFTRKYKERTGKHYRDNFAALSRWWIDPVSRMKIYRRDKWICQLCFEPVDPKLNHQSDPMGATLDHIVPVSLSATPDHSPENLRLAHRSCNSARGNRVNVDVA